MDIRDVRLLKKKTGKKPRKIMVVNPSKYGTYEAIHSNKEYWKSIFNDIDATASESIEESKRLAKVLPTQTYEKVCNILDIPIVNLDQGEVVGPQLKPMRLSLKEPLVSTRKSLYIEREMDSDTDVEYCPSDDEEKLNIHQELLNKPVREQVTWATRYLQPEKEEEKSLIRKADDLTERIASDFCKYIKEMGGDQQSRLFTPQAIKELFQIEFDTHVARGLRVVTRELPCVEEKIANVTGYPEKARYAALEREISKDIEAEHRPDKISAFGRSLPRQDRWRAPTNDTNNLWRSARHVPRDLVTLKTVWEGITNLRSVKEYCRWMIEHPEYRRAPYLSSLGLFDPAVLEARLTFEARPGSPPATPGEAPAPIDHIRRRLSELADTS
ncbi:uncharacterized protein LOC114365096 [Ostrinia furnacalis]|uniref:uncharacterized protein LOC114365096 n=1 Tax=Ostrinia furnacalis TaxID=93504 RepID=UPI00103B8E69|nr:uncharacterized protein LOC114365096 [Ostrinia furnacalis]